ncbi:MAG: hypothetical protein ACOYJY_06835 [Acutalibacteraceae bacterium]|jgi:hypothetical protein
MKGKHRIIVSDSEQHHFGAQAEKHHQPPRAAMSLAVQPVSAKGLKIAVFMLY